ncbi:MAG: hypothetical protein AAGU12_04350 [Clostridiales bacterium]
MKKNKIRKMTKMVTLVLILFTGLGASLAYGYWVDQIQGDWQVSFSRPITIHVMGLTPPEPLKLPLDEAIENPAAGMNEGAEGSSSSGEQAPAPTAEAEEKAGSGEAPASGSDTNPDPGPASDVNPDPAPQSQTVSAAGNDNTGAEADGKDE